MTKINFTNEELDTIYEFLLIAKDVTKVPEEDKRINSVLKKIDDSYHEENTAKLTEYLIYSLDKPEELLFSSFTRSEDQALLEWAKEVALVKEDPRQYEINKEDNE